MFLPSPHQSTDSLPNVVPPIPPPLPLTPPPIPPPIPPSARNAPVMYGLIIITLLFSSFQQARLSNTIPSISYWSSTVIILVIWAMVGYRNRANSYRRRRIGAITSIVIYKCASTAALYSNGDKRVAISASVMHLGTLLLAAANVYTQRRTRDATLPPLMIHFASVWQALVVLIANVVFLRSSLDRNILSFRIASASITPAFLSHLSIIWLRETGYGCRFLEFDLLATNAERCSFLLNVYALLPTFSSVFWAALPLLKEMSIILAFILFTVFCAVTYSLIVYQEELARIGSSNV